MKNLFLYLFVFVFFSVSIATQLQSAEKIILQLKWDNQFQFAGYYAAKWMGYYKEVGLDVEIRSAIKPNNKILSAIREVTEKRADFGIGSADILIAIDKGADLSILATIFQQSAARLYYIKGKTTVNSLADLTHLRVARNINDLIDVEFQAMLRAEGINPASVSKVPHLNSDKQFIKGEIDILPGNSISVPYLEKTKGIKLKSIKPSSYGIDFYGDSIFTRHSLIIDKPEVVKNFVSASLKGWEYALENPDIIAQRISNKLVRTAPVKDFLNFNRFQIKGVKKLTLFPIVDLGHINPDRWKHMHNLLKKEGILKNNLDIHKVIYNPEVMGNGIFSTEILLVYIFIILMITFLFLFWVKVLRKSVFEQTKELSFSAKKLSDEIGERKRSESEQRLSEARFRKMIEKSPLPMVITDENQDIVFFSNKFTELFGYTLEDVSTVEKWWTIAYPDEKYRTKVKQSWEAAIEKAIANKTDIEMQECNLTTKNRSVKRCEFYMVPLDDISLIVMKDITDQKKMRDALEESEKKFKGLFENAPLSYQSLDVNGDFTEVNETWLSTLGYSRSEVIGKNFSNFLVPGWKNHFAENFPRFKSIGEVLGVEFEMLKKDGSVILVSFHGKIGKDMNGIFERTHCVFHDITKQKSADDILKKELELNKAIARISTELLSEIYNIKKVADVTLDTVKTFTKSEHGFVSSIDRATLENVGHTLSEMFGENCRVKDQKIAFPIGEDGKYSALWGHSLNTKEAFYTNQPEEHHKYKGLPEGHIKLKNFLSVPVLIGNSLLGQIALANSEQNYTDQDLKSIKRIAEVFALAVYRQDYEYERTKMEKNIRQLQKNEAIGILASGIAHDFNNILFPIIGFAEILEEDLPEDSPLLECANEILTGALRAKDLVKQIMTFSKQVELEVRPVAPHIIVKEVTRLIKSTLPSTIEIKQNIGNCRTVIADPTQIHQITMNLITNAYHSMQESGGILTINLKDIDITKSEGTLNLDAGKYVCLSISDTGIGMNEETKTKIFDPYFSTKSKDEGTGLGLSVVHGIIKNYGGDINVKSDLNQGSTFEVFFPALAKNYIPEIKTKKKDIPKGTEKILLIDDELPILNLEQAKLKRLGYKIDISSNSEEALETIKLFPNKYDLIITDNTMPKITGLTLVKEIRETNNQIPVIICTGFSGNITLETVKKNGANALLIKPIILADLAVAIRDVIDSKNEDISS
ncbi:MAG: ABC transporter substrate-binding protein [Desulfobacterales bacterium]|nr:ABC transporter substrate-binding protein [Desulfobacterales bacterium]